MMDILGDDIWYLIMDYLTDASLIALRTCSKRLCEVISYKYGNKSVKQCCSDGSILSLGIICGFSNDELERMIMDADIDNSVCIGSVSITTRLHEFNDILQQNGHRDYKLYCMHICEHGFGSTNLFVKTTRDYSMLVLMLMTKTTSVYSKLVSLLSWDQAGRLGDICTRYIFYTGNYEVAIYLHKQHPYGLLKWRVIFMHLHRINRIDIIKEVLYNHDIKMLMDEKAFVAGLVGDNDYYGKILDTYDSSEHPSGYFESIVNEYKCGRKMNE